MRPYHLQKFLQLHATYCKPKNIYLNEQVNSQFNENTDPENREYCNRSLNIVKQILATLLFQNIRES